MVNHWQFCVDLETRGLYHNAVLTRIAVTPFHLDDDKNTTFKELVDRTLYLSFDQDDQLSLGNVIDKSVEDWWSTQTEELKVESYYPTDHDLSSIDVLLKCKSYLKSWKYDHFNSYIWARNVSFESQKLQHLNETLFPGEKKQVFNNWNWHEVKTFNWLLTAGETCKYVPEDMDSLGFNYHAANHDSSMDALRMIRLWNQE